VLKSGVVIMKGPPMKPKMKEMGKVRAMLSGQDENEE
jgi:hypothetical protein